MNSESVKVAVRVRQVDQGCQTCLSAVPGESKIQIHQSVKKALAFDRVFPEDSSQEEFYNTAVKNLVLQIFKGYNVTILAYGHTSSGKTHTMGTNYHGMDNDCGVIPRAVNDVFRQIQSKSQPDEFKVKVQFMELFQEQSYDLLSIKPRHKRAVEIKEDQRGTLKFVGLSEVLVDNADATLQSLADGSLNRATEATVGNSSSHRSHAIFSVSVHRQRKGEPNTVEFAKLEFIDLAGSEWSTKGLSALEHVIWQLSQGENPSNVGYGESQLTRILQNCLGGNSVTLMISCVSPASLYLKESMSTLECAAQARKIKNKPRVNQDPCEESQSATIGQANENEDTCPQKPTESTNRESLPESSNNVAADSEATSNNIEDNGPQSETCDLVVQQENLTLQESKRSDATQHIKVKSEVEEHSSSKSNFLALSTVVENVEKSKAEIGIRVEMEFSDYKEQIQSLQNEIDKSKAKIKNLTNDLAKSKRSEGKLESKLKDALERNKQLKIRLAKYELAESSSKSRKRSAGSAARKNSMSDTEKDQLINDLQRQLSVYREQSETAQNKVLAEINSNVTIRKTSKARTKPKVARIPSVDENDIIEDDRANDPDWLKTPKTQKKRTSRNSARDESKTGLKRSSNGDVKCVCKSKCATKWCSCRRNGALCTNCNCDPNICKNKDDKKESETPA